MPYILKVKKTGNYVTNNNRFAAHRWEGQPDINKARVFQSVSGIKRWYGNYHYRNKEDFLKVQAIWKEKYMDRLKTESFKRVYKEYYENEVQPLIKPYDEDFEVIELDFNKQ